MNMCTKFQVDIFKNGWDIDIKHVKNRHFSRHFGTLSWFSEFCFLTDFDASKSVLGSFFAFFAKIWPKNMYGTSKSRNFFAWPFSPGDLRWPWPVLWSQSTGNDTYKMLVTLCMPIQLALFALNIEILLADVTKPEKSKILDFDLTCDVTQWPPRSIKFDLLPRQFTYRAIEWRLKF